MSETSHAAVVDLDIDHDEPHWSISQVTMYQRCPKQWEYRYAKGLKRPPTAKMANGTGLHAAFEYNNITKIDTGQDAPMDQLLDITAEEHEKAFLEVEDAKPGEKDKLKDENVEISRFYRRTQAPHILPIRAEAPFTLHVPSDDRGDYLPVIGYIDSSAQVPDYREGPTQGRLVKSLEDYKRVTYRKTQQDVDLSIQLTLYDFVYTVLGETHDVIGLRSLGFNGPRSRSQEGPGPYTLPVYRSPSLMTPTARPDRHERALETLRSVQLLSQTGLFPPTDDPRVCSWCGYNDICQEAR